MQPQVIICKDRAEWLEARKDGLGASDAAALLGLSPWKTNVQLWEEKCGLVIPEDIGDKPYVRYGNDAVTGKDKSMVIKHQMPDDTPVSLVFEIVATGNVKDRTVIGSATRSEFGDRQMHSSDVLGYDLTVAANDMGDGVTSIEYIGIPKG